MTVNLSIARKWENIIKPNSINLVIIIKFKKFTQNRETKLLRQAVSC